MLLNCPNSCNGKKERTFIPDQLQTLMLAVKVRRYNNALQ